MHRSADHMITLPTRAAEVADRAGSGRCRISFCNRGYATTGIIAVRVAIRVQKGTTMSLEVVTVIDATVDRSASRPCSTNVGS